jgi:TrpR-related protein YerC/YecD
MSNDKLRSSALDRLFQAILTLRDEEDCYHFFEDLCTVAELKELAQRLEVAEMLRDGQTYGEIVQKTGASTATVSRVKRALFYGADGYRTVIERMPAEKAGE